MADFDYIIVGAGSAGCVLANRLSANPATRVLLIEDGGTNQHPFIKMAGGFVKIMAWDAQGNARLWARVGRILGHQRHVVPARDARRF